MSIHRISCQKNTELKAEYEAGGGVSEYNLYYFDQGGELIQVLVSPESVTYRWTCSFLGEKGDIVYLSGNYKNPNSVLNLMIKLNEKY